MQLVVDDRDRDDQGVDAVGSDDRVDDVAQDAERRRAELAGAGAAALDRPRQVGPVAEQLGDVGAQREPVDRDVAGAAPDEDDAGPAGERAHREEVEVGPAEGERRRHPAATRPPRGPARRRGRTGGRTGTAASAAGRARAAGRPTPRRRTRRGRAPATGRSAGTPRRCPRLWVAAISRRCAPPPRWCPRIPCPGSSRAHPGGRGTVGRRGARPPPAGPLAMAGVLAAGGRGVKGREMAKAPDPWIRGLRWLIR